VKECVRCIMNDVVDPHLTLGAGGVCHHCRRYDELVGARVLGGAAGRAALDRICATIKRRGAGRDYDCIIGVSGGVDSTYVAFLVKQLGMRPLAVHLDNGWNSELAVANIERALKVLDIELLTHVIDWEEFRDLQVAFLRASTPDGEIPSDHAINALLWRTAIKVGAAYIISGMNFATEALSVPHWAYGHSDWRYIKDVHRRFGRTPLRTYPHYGLARLAWMNAVRGVRTISILNYVDYDKAAAIEVLRDKLGWRDYGGKHHESIYTRFFQGYILPRKFGIDKRYGHLSDLINAGQLTRAQALVEVEAPPYPEVEQARDLEYVVRKLGLTPTEFDSIMRAPIRSFRDYHNSYSTVQFLRNAVNRLRARGLYPR
jgi:N-acetyl sugar amidotransferase